jgi:hypothetical protein
MHQLGSIRPILKNILYMKSKLYCLLLIVFLTSLEGFSQSPLTFQRNGINRKNNVSAGPGAPASPSPQNPWITAGVQAGYSLNGGDFANNFQASGRTLIEVLGRRTRDKGIFLMGNLSRLSNLASTDIDLQIKEIQQSTQGINIGIYPHKVYGRTDDDDLTFITLYTPVIYKINKFNNASDSGGV